MLKLMFETAVFSKLTTLRTLFTAELTIEGNRESTNARSLSFIEY